MLKDNIFAQIKKAPISEGYRWRRDWLPAIDVTVAYCEPLLRIGLLS
jgi:hypothetical protein